MGGGWGVGGGGWGEYPSPPPLNKTLVGENLLATITRQGPWLTQECVYVTIYHLPN